MKIPRRDFLRIGAIPMFGLRLQDYLKINHKNSKSIIFFYLYGGPSQIDTYDPKPEAPAEIRGIYNPISTNIPGIKFSQLLPKQAAIADKICLIRSYSHTNIDHDDAQILVVSGHDTFNVRRPPSFASVSAKLLDQKERTPLPYLFLGSKSYHNFHHGVGDMGMLPTKFNPLFIENDPNNSEFKVKNFNLDGITIEDIESRRNLLWNLDNFKRFGDQKRMEEVDSYQQQAIDILTGSGIAKAFDIGEEKRKVCDDYGRTTIGQRALLARRLVEVGIPIVSISYKPDHPKLRRGFQGWDHHQDIFPQLTDVCPPFDQAIAALIDDLDCRGILDNVLVIAFGEFGRTPKINAEAGRDHWAKNSCVLLAGGGLPRGVVYKDKPVSPQDLLATIYNLMEFPLDTRIFDKTGRGHLITEGRPILF
ncbi:MAG: DUF1501 domain-containing protein [Patescibacteria group bacterium]